MAPAVLVALLSVQDPVQRQLDEVLRRFEQAVRAQETYEALSDRLAALGEAALGPIARRLAQDLRDGVPSAAAPALLAALEGHPEALGPLRETFEHPDTDPSGRLEIALALARLHDHQSWRDGLRSLADDPSAEPDDRVRAAEILLLDDELAGVPAVRKPEAEVEEPRVSLVEEPASSAGPGRRGAGEGGRKKDETSDDGFLTMRSVVAGTAAGLLALFLALKRKG